MASICGGPSTSVPIGGEGASAKCSKIFLLPPDCTNGILLNGTAPSGTTQWFNEQVTRIEVRPRVTSRVYGHDKSYCCQDEVSGIYSWDGSIQTRAQCCPGSPGIPFSLYAGALAWLQIWPLGSTETAAPIAGYARITDDPIMMNLETGDPVEHNYTYVSKGLWTLPAGLTGYVNCCVCTECGTGGMGEEIEAEPEPGLLDSDPVTVYKWTDKGEWVVAFDELPPGFVRGLAPTEHGKKDGEMKFVKCIKVAPTADLHSHSGLVAMGV